MINKNNILERVYIAILLVIFGGIVLHAPIIVGLGTLWPQYDLLIKTWKEILMLIAGTIALILMYQKKQFQILRNPIMIAIGAYAMLHLLLLAYQPTGVGSSLAGLAIDLRYFLYFGLIYIAMQLYPNYHNIFIRVGIIGALIVLIFALLQVFILPNDILKYIGYNVNTISPYLTVDQNNDFIRINSTLRGPNPLGAYAGMVLTLIVAAITKNKVKKEKWSLILVAILSFGGVVALWSSYSRSALVATICAIAIVLSVTTIKKMSFNLWISAISVVLISVGGFLFISDSSFVSNILLHKNPNSGSSIDSNQDHVDSLQNGLNKFINQPLGAGVGSTGSASLYSDSPIVIENQYFFIAHEAGWLGLGLFIYIFGLILIYLWNKRKNWLVLGVFASGIGLAIIGVLLPVLVDDTVSIVWWGMAAVALSSQGLGNWKRVEISRRSKKGIIKE